MDDLIYTGIDVAETGIGAVAKRFARHSVVKWLMLFRQNIILLLAAAFFWAGTTFTMSVNGEEPVEILPIPQNDSIAIACFVVWLMAIFPWASEKIFGALAKALIIPAIDRVVGIFKPSFSLMARMRIKEATESMALLDRMSMAW